MKRVHLSIDTLRLRGFRPEDRHAIASGLQQELTRLLAASHTAAGLERLGSVPVMKPPHVTVPHGSWPRSVGVQVARAISLGVKP